MISRELKSEARNPLNYWFRVLGAGVVVAGFALIMANQRGSAAQLGARLFRELNSMLFFSVAIFVPMLTADCLSREKREGTLGLLFLTPLTARDVIVGKSLIHTIRAFTLVVAALPILALPFLLGGVTGPEVAQAISSNLSALLLGLAAGLLASVRNVEWVRAVVMAELLNGFFILVWSFGSSAFGWFIWQFGAILSRSGSNLAVPLFSLFSAALNVLLFSLSRGASLLIAGFLFLLVIRRAIAHLERTWQEETTAPAQPRWVRMFSTSYFWQSVFQWNKSKTLDRNPIAWLQEYSWTARLTKWGWFFGILLGELTMLFNYGFFLIWQVRLAMVLALGISFTSAWSFRRERQSGALELLLVTPLSAGQVIRGRLWGLWAHFFPAGILLLFLWYFNPFQYPRMQSHLGLVTFFACTFVTLPVIGLLFSLTRWHFLVAWLLTASTGLLLPYFATSIVVQSTRGYGRSNALSYWIICAFEIAFASYGFYRLYCNLTQRSFAIEHTSA